MLLALLTAATLYAAVPTTAPRPFIHRRNANDIHIGLVAAINGDLKPWGEEEKRGVQLAIDEFNAAGGLNGRKVVLDVEDSNSMPMQGRQAAQTLIAKDKDILLIGEVASGLTAQIADVAATTGVPVITPGSTRTDLTANRPNLFRVCFTDAFQGPAMAKFAYDDLHLRSVEIVTDMAQPYSTGLSDGFKDYFTKLGGKIVGEQFYTSSENDFSKQIAKLNQDKPDGVFLTGYFNEVGPIIRQAGEAGIHVPMMGGDGWDSSEILKSGGQAIIGAYFCNHYNNVEPRTAVKTFLAKWAAKYDGEVPGTTMGALGYDAAALACNALKRAKQISPAGLQAAIENTEGFPGVTGEITLKGKHGNPPKRALVVEITEKGQVFVKNIKPDPVTGLPK